jgi:hypothetical protein
VPILSRPVYRKQAIVKFLDSVRDHGSCTDGS